MEIDQRKNDAFSKYTALYKNRNTCNLFELIEIWTKCVAKIMKQLMIVD